MDTFSEGKFVAVEGLDGAGTTTLIASLVEWLRSQSVPVEATHEPTAGPVGSVIRQAIDRRLDFDADILALLFAADRLDHLRNAANGIERQLASGHWVISDRYLASSFAYQGGATGGGDWVRTINRHARPPDLTIYVDTSIATCLERIARRSGKDELFHRAASLEQASVRYEAFFAAEEPIGPVLKVNGDQPASAVLNDALKLVGPWLHST
ncbi:dTMP kinase [Gordonia sp. 'Campus']|uniref:dTMP kinase n=1 Tax=Gordonia sp. 'Campus' TaxID=2915824 RepID=UPI001EE47BDE|nr:dTMP kinase [Gordonia sp. 'Campus']